MCISSKKQRHCLCFLAFLRRKYTISGRSDPLSHRRNTIAHAREYRKRNRSTAHRFLLSPPQSLALDCGGAPFRQLPLIIREEPVKLVTEMPGGPQAETVRGALVPTDLQVRTSIALHQSLPKTGSPSRPNGVVVMGRGEAGTRLRLAACGKVSPRYRASTTRGGGMASAMTEGIRAFRFRAIRERHISRSLYSYN